jgi:hypothetical protein
MDAYDVTNKPVKNKLECGMLLYASLCIFLTSAFYFVNKAAVPVKQNR